MGVLKTMADTNSEKQPLKELDLEDRDYHMLNEYLVVDFEDIIAEPESIHTFPIVWNGAFNCFNFCHTFCYTLHTLCCGFCAVLQASYGIAGSFFCHVWCGTPALKCVTYWVALPKRLVNDCVECALIPCCDDLGTHLKTHLKS